MSATPRESIQSLMKFGKRSKSCMNIIQKPANVIVKKKSLGSSSPRKALYNNISGLALESRWACRGSRKNNNGTKLNKAALAQAMNTYSHFIKRSLPVTSGPMNPPTLTI